MDYTIIKTYYKFGHIEIPTSKENIRTLLEEELKKTKLQAKFDKEPTRVHIEVLNNNTGEIREYWNNTDNTINF